MRVVVHYIDPLSCHLEALTNFHFNALQQKCNQFNSRFSLLLLVCSTKLIIICWLLLKYNYSSLLCYSIIIIYYYILCCFVFYFTIPPPPTLLVDFHWPMPNARTPPLESQFPPLNYSFPGTSVNWDSNMVEMSPEALKNICKQHSLYSTHTRHVVFPAR